MFERCCPCLTLEFFQRYFDVTTEDIKKRLLTSLLPCSRSFYAMYKEKPDLYGPFWIYTTLVIVLAVAGNLSRLLQSGSAAFTYNFHFIPVAFAVIFGAGLGLPFALKLLMKFMGAAFFSGTFMEILGIYGYSFTSFLVTALVCAVPVSGLQWAFVAYAAVTSTGFLVTALWSDLQQALEPKRRLAVITFICAA